MKFIGLITNNQYVEINFKNNDKKNIGEEKSKEVRKFIDEFGKELDDSLMSLNDFLHPEGNNK